MEDECKISVGLFTVDEYINIAKEKHGYNTEQVGDWCVCMFDMS